MRIIAGTFRGRRLKTPKGMDTRPTQDRVRETIFNVLQHKGIAGRRVLDVYAGTGAMGLEAMSRGADSLVAIDKRTGKLVQENAALCGVSDKTEVIPIVVERAGTRLSGRQFDLVFSDPPYLKDGMSVTIDVLTRFGLLAEGAIIVLECEQTETYDIPPTWSLWKEQRFGYTKVSYYIYHVREEV